MSRYFETIRIEQGRPCLLPLHQRRFEAARMAGFGLRVHPRLSDLIRVPEESTEGRVKCRVVYGREIEEIEFLPYLPRKVERIRLIRCDEIDYGNKYTDRSRLDELFSLRGDCDDIMIVKRGFITDSYVANLVFRDGSRWLTPDTPLLPGVMRASLLAEGRIQAVRITAEDLGKFEGLRLINALNPLDDGPELSIDVLQS